MSDETAHYMESTSRLREKLQAALEVGDRAVDQRDRLRAENEELRQSRDVLDRSDRTKGRELADAWRTINQIESVLTDHGVAITSPLSDAVLEQLATMREVAEELRRLAIPQREPSHAAQAHIDALTDLADRLAPPPKEQ